MRINITITGDWLETVNSPLVYIDKLIKKAKEHQKGWKKMRPRTAMEVGIEPKEMVKLFKHIEIALILIRFLYYSLIVGILKVVGFFRDVFGI